MSYKPNAIKACKQAAEILERLAWARKNAGLSQSQAGKLLGLSVGGFCDIEKGRNPLYIERFLLLCEIYDISPTWALTGTNPKFDLQAALDKVKSITPEILDLVDMMESFRQEGD